MTSWDRFDAEKRIRGADYCSPTPRWAAHGAWTIRIAIDNNGKI
jgi:hypothetical protein